MIRNENKVSIRWRKRLGIGQIFLLKSFVFIQQAEESLDGTAICKDLSSFITLLGPTWNNKKPVRKLFQAVSDMDIPK